MSADVWGAIAHSVRAPTALLAEGWHNDVLIGIDGDGIIARIDIGSGTPTPSAPAFAARGPVVPGMPNLHSHAFQRAMTGLTEKAGPQGDSFWSWRELMYRFLERLTPDDIGVIARQLYIEMLCAGYTSVAEFHYLHHDPFGKPYANLAETGLEIQQAAFQCGIGLTMLPVLYAHGNFGGAPASPGQRRFLNGLDDYARLVEALVPAENRARISCLGLAPHSMRATTPVMLDAVAQLLKTLRPHARCHIHVAEQAKEIADCLAWSNTTPVAWLLDHGFLDANWCCIHATHMTAAEIDGLANSRAVAGLCPTTEGDLGDGIFAAVPFLEAQGQFGIGGDSHVAVDPFLELRLFEYSQRLQHERRNLLASTPGESLGGRLYRSAAIGGAQALGQPVGQLALGARADLVVLDEDDAALMERQGDDLFDAAIFGPVRRPVRDVMVAGQWRVRDGCHALEEQSKAAFRATLKRLLA